MIIKELFYDISNVLHFGKMPGFIHIPKTGGTYLTQYETSENPILYPMKTFGHCCIANKFKHISSDYPPKDCFPQNSIRSKQRLQFYYIFANVRNIFDWLVSYWGHAAGTNPKYHNPNHYDFKAANKGFEYFLKTIASRDYYWPSTKFIYFAIFSYNGNLIVDWLNRVETLDSDLKKLAEYRGISYSRKEKQRIGKREMDYRYYYNDSLIDLVYKTWGRELKLFGYDFNGLDINKAIIKRSIPSRQKKNIKYKWQEDRLFINGEELR